MTISTTSSVITYLGNGSATIFTFPFVADTANDIEVILTTAGVQTILPQSQYTLVINAVPVGGLWGIGGSVTYPISGSPIQVGTSISIVRIVPYTQNTSINNQGAFYPQVVEQAMDVLELQIQQIETTSTYAIQAPISDPNPPNVLPPAALRANGYLAFDNNGEPIVVTSAPVPVIVTYALPRRVTTTGTATLSMSQSDSLGGISIYQTGPAVTTVQLPAGYGPYPVFDASLNASSYPIKILPPLGYTIAGQTFYILSFNGQSNTFYNDGLNILIG